MDRFWAYVFLVSSAFPSLFAQDVPLPQEQIQALIYQAANKDFQSQKLLRNYTYSEREEQHELDRNERTTSTEIKSYENMILYSEPVRKLVGKDDKPLTDKDARKEDERIQKIVDKLKDESDDERKKRIEKADREREESRQFVKEIPDAFNFRWVGMETLNGREAYVIDADPRPGYVPHGKNAKFLPKFHFRVWIDKTESHWVKIDIQCIDTVSVGLFLVRMHKGSNIQVELTRVNDEVWLPKHLTGKLDARVALFKGVNIADDVTYRDYKKFGTNTKIMPLGEMQ